MNPSDSHPQRQVPCITRGDLLRQHQRAAQVRSMICMVLFVVILLAVSLLMSDFMTDDPNRNWIPILIIFGSFYVLSWIITRVYCVPKVVFPNCGYSLWKCGTGNFKPRRMKLRKDATACPGCGIRII